MPFGTVWRGILPFAIFGVIALSIALYGNYTNNVYLVSLPIFTLIFSIPFWLQSFEKKIDKYWDEYWKRDKEE